VLPKENVNLANVWLQARLIIATVCMHLLRFDSPGSDVESSIEDTPLVLTGGESGKDS
jgi:hypothetical protein